MEEATIQTFGTLPFPPVLNICKSLNVSNAPALESGGSLIVAPFFSVNEKVVLATYPVEKGCLSSGFGMRNGRRHKGVDYANPAPVKVYAGGQGRVVEAGTHRDFGNYVLIHHGWGIYSRYAHLASIAPQITYKYEVIMGENIGVMGKTGRNVTGRHLHYEVLAGDYNTPKKSFGLNALDIFTLPEMWPQ